MKSLAGPLVILVLAAPAGAAQSSSASEAPPRIFWASEPVRPNETVVLLGDGLRADAVLEAVRSEGGDPSPAAAWTSVTPLQAGPQSLKAVIPADWKFGPFACRVRIGQSVSNELVLNAPRPWWWNGDAGETAAPGGWVRLFGASLNFGGASRVRLCAADGRTIPLSAAAADNYSLRCPLPAELATGDYAMSVHNGLGGEAAWRSAGTLRVDAAAAWKSDLLNVKDFGPRPGEALLAALKKAEANGGGIVYLPRGRYPVKNRLVIPRHTILRGEAMGLVTLYWPDFETPPPALIGGADCGIESLSVYCQNHKDVVSDMPASRRFFLRNVRIRANCLYRLLDAGESFRGRHGPASYRQCGAAVRIGGRNFEITGCDIYASNYALQVDGGKIGLIANNRICYGGRAHRFEFTDRLIFEDNHVSGCNLQAHGNDITTFYSSYCRHIYYARNRVEQVYGADREVMTLDAAGGAYYGKIAAAEGTKLILAADPVFRDYNKRRPHTDWTGATVQVLDGRGTGQYRIVTAHQGRDWHVDRPWIVPPDASSTIAIGPFRGRDLFIGNTYADCGSFQLYGSAHDTIVANNRGTRMGAFLVWGLNGHGWGPLPCFGCQFFDNEIAEGNDYGALTGGFGAISSPSDQGDRLPLVRAAIFRRNMLDNNAHIGIGQRCRDTLVENCLLRDSDLGIIDRTEGQTTLLRGNTLTGAARPPQPSEARK